MRKRISSVLWGLIFIAVGVGVAGAMTGLWTLQVFNGWWTLFLIVPAILSIIERGFTVGNTVSLTVGAALLACCRGYLSWNVLYQLLVPAVMIIIGLVMVCKSMFHIGSRRVQVPNDQRAEQLVVFSGKNMIVQNEFYGMDADAVFGGLTVDLRNAVITENISIDTMAVFGGVDIFVPKDVNVVLSDTSLFGGCSKPKRRHLSGVPTIYVNAIAMFGGVEVK